jgi:type II secretory pathway pseudopilin PulG
MIKSSPIRRRHHPSEEGYILIWVMFLLAIFTLSLSIAVPRIAKSIQRDRERETVERGKQYIRAVQLYYRKFHAYPPNADALVKTTEIRFLRKKYIDPTTGKDDWKPVLFGQNKTPTAMGFFGQPLAGSASTVAGIGPSGGGGISGGSMIGGPGSSFGSSSIFGSSNSGTSPGAPAAAAGSPADSSAGSSTGPSGTGGTGGTGGIGSAGTGGSSSTGTGLSGQTFGGAGIIGFSPAGTKESILVYKKKNHYNEWEFVYDPLNDMKTQSGNTGNIGQPASSTTTPIGGSNIGPGAGGGTGPSSSSGLGSNPPAPTPPTSPQQ